MRKDNLIFAYEEGTLTKIKIIGIISVGVRAQIGILGLGPYSRIWIRPRRSR